MLYEVVVNDWGETTYVPTALGNILLAAVLAALLVCAVFFALKHTRKNAGPEVNPEANPEANQKANRKANQKSNPKSNPKAGQNANPKANQKFNQKASAKLTIKQLAFCAMAIALGSVLSNIKVFSFPTGGSVTLFSMLIICLPGYFFGAGAGILTGIAYGVLQMLMDPYILFPAQLVLDYLLAFGALGLSGFCCGRKNGLLKGYLIAVSGRYVFVVLSGWIFFGMYAWEGWSPLSYSLVYNAIYIFSEAAVTVLMLCLPPVAKGIGYVRKLASE